jgi:hypothetical protein
MSNNYPLRNNISSINPKNVQALIVKAQSVLDDNDRGKYTVPSAGLYPHQVLWDSCFVAIGRCHYDVERAKSEVLSLLSAQWQNGMIPHIVFSNEKRYWWDRRIWRSKINPNASSSKASSGISQPPMLVEAVVRIGRQLSKEKEIDWYKSVFPQLVKYHLWLYRERDPKSEGLVVQIHPWETGLDNSPPCMIELRNKCWPKWFRILDKSYIDKLSNHLRFDSKYVPSSERASNSESLALYYLLRKIRHNKYDSKTILFDPAFAIQDVTYNSILIRANNLLSEISKTIHLKLPTELSNHFAKANKSLDSLWDNQDLQYYSRQLLSGKLIKEPSIGTFLPLYAGTISHEQATELVKLLENKATFNLKFSIPTVPANSPWFSEYKYWQGPTWINTNWLIIDGLNRYGFHEQARTLAKATLEIVNKSGFYEYYDSLTGTPRGVNNFSWTAALIIDLAYNYLKTS